ncbi:MAG TPA: MtnX-like HAD-IB family phosphatase [Hyphomicrobiaceae bacterium]|nr:MtnX-like HAD-IB family phosphatase [Hyphomicrobiaceae bacterium]
MSRSRVKCHVFVDFDGTISPVDTTDLLLERFGEPAWRDIEDDWKAGRIGSRECLVRQIDLVRATPSQVDELISGIEIDPAFYGFVDHCRRLGHSVTVVSDGLDRTVRTVLERNNINVPFYANKLQWRGDDRWRLTFPYARSDCATLSGNCKCRFAEGQRRKLQIVIGDGRSDFCIAERVDLVLAKGALVKHCRKAGLPHYTFSHFGEASELLSGWLEQRIPTQREPQRPAKE